MHAFLDHCKLYPCSMDGKVHVNFHLAILTFAFKYKQSIIKIQQPHPWSISLMGDHRWHIKCNGSFDAFLTLSSGIRVLKNVNFQVYNKMKF
jgi:hypothetical protein